MAKQFELDKNHEIFSNACLDGDMGRVKELMTSNKVDLTAVWTGEFFYPLMAAIIRNNVELALYLLENGMPVYFNTALAYQNFESEDEIKQQLVFEEWVPEYGDALLAVSKFAQRFPVVKGVSRSLIGIADLDEIDCDERTDEFLNNLFLAGADVDYPLYEGTTPLHLIVNGKNKKYVEKFIGLSKKIDVHTDDGLFDTPLFRATEKCRDYAIISLVEKGANPNLVSEPFNQTVLDAVLKFSKENSFQNTDGKLDRLIEFLRAHGAKGVSELST